MKLVFVCMRLLMPNQGGNHYPRSLHSNTCAVEQQDTHGRNPEIKLPPIVLVKIKSLRLYIRVITLADICTLLVLISLAGLETAPHSSSLTYDGHDNPPPLNPLCFGGIHCAIFPHLQPFSINQYTPIEIDPLEREKIMRQKYFQVEEIVQRAVRYKLTRELKRK